MAKKFRYVVVIAGEIPARNKAQGYTIIQHGFAIIGRLLQFPHDIAIKLEEMEEPEKSTADLADDALDKAVK